MDDMLPLADWPAAARRGIVGVLTDIDDTLTTDSAITADALEALGTLKAAGLHVVPITGRPVGWSEPFALRWPVDAIVAENGAVALLPGPGGTLAKKYQQDPATRAANFVRMQAVAQRVLAEVPGTLLATDSAGRETDIAIDHSEYTHLPPETIARVVALLRGEGMNATVSSIHINAWYGGHDKLAGARWIVRELWRRDLDAEIDRWVYIGDSTNDQKMFERFPHSVGVANIARFVPMLAHLPRYLTASARGAGFAEVAHALTSVRA